MIFRSIEAFREHILANEDHPAHVAVRTQALKERRENDPRLRATAPIAERLEPGEQSGLLAQSAVAS